MLEQRVVLRTMEDLASIRHHVTIPPCAFGMVEGGVRSAHETVLAGDVGRVSTGDTQANGHGDHGVMVDKTMRLNFFPETLGQALRLSQTSIGQNQGESCVPVSDLTPQSPAVPTPP